MCRHVVPGSGDLAPAGWLRLLPPNFLEAPPNGWKEQLAFRKTIETAKGAYIALVHFGLSQVATLLGEAPTNGP
jgi:hypothetical protein